MMGADKYVLAGLPLPPSPRIAGAIFYSITDPDPATCGCPWLLPGGGSLLRLDREKLSGDVYTLSDERADTLLACVIRFLNV